MWILDLLGLFILGLVPGTTRTRGSLEEMQKRHPRSLVRRAEVLERWATTNEEQAVAFLVANRQKISLRDAYGHEELHWSLDELGDPESIPSGPGFTGQQYRLRSKAGLTLSELWSPDSEGDVLTDLTTTLRR